jgi:auxin-responsive protein IAA
MKLICKKRPLIKINMDGIPIGRKINLTAYDSYQKVSSAVEELFRGFLEGTNYITRPQKKKSNHFE